MQLEILLVHVVQTCGMILTTTKILTITTHFINNEWMLHSCVLATTQFPEKNKTGENIKEEIEKRLTELETYPEHMQKIFFVTDQGLNIRKAFETYSYYPCIAHCINTVLKHVFDDQLLACQHTIDAVKSIVQRTQILNSQGWKTQMSNNE